MLSDSNIISCLPKDLFFPQLCQFCHVVAVSFSILIDDGRFAALSHDPVSGSQYNALAEGKTDVTGSVHEIPEMVDSFH